MEDERRNAIARACATNECKVGKAGELITVGRYPAQMPRDLALCFVGWLVETAQFDPEEVAAAADAARESMRR